MRCCATNKGSQRPLTHCRRPRQFAPAVRDNAIDYSPERLAQGAACVQVARHSKRYSAAGAGQGRGAVAPRLLFARPTDVQVLRPGRVRRGGWSLRRAAALGPRSCARLNTAGHAASAGLCCCREDPGAAARGYRLRVFRNDCHHGWRSPAGACRRGSARPAGCPADRSGCTVGGCSGAAPGASAFRFTGTRPGARARVMAALRTGQRASWP